MDTKIQTPLESVFSNTTETLNGDIAFKSTNSNMVDILFQVNWLTQHPEEISIGDSPKEKIFAMFMRDCRHGIGARNVGRRLLELTGASFEDILLCGRADDIWKMFSENEITSPKMAKFLYDECSRGNELVKKWMPRWTPRNRMPAPPPSNTIIDIIPNAEEIMSMSSVENAKAVSEKARKEYTEHQLLRIRIAKKLCRIWGMNKQEYKKFVKCDTTENKLSRRKWDSIDFEHVPSLAMIKYTRTFAGRPELSARYKAYIEDVRAGRKKLNASVTTVYDIYKARNNEGFDPDLWFEKTEKIGISAVTIMDTSSSMYKNDTIGKALSICHYLSKCSSYCTGQFVTFSASPELVTIKGASYNEEMNSIQTAKWGMNTDLSKVAELLKNLRGEMPEWMFIVSDMQFDEGSTKSMKELMDFWKENGIKTKIVWWNLSTINATTPETVEGGNIFMSGLSPMLMKYLKCGFDAEKFLNVLIEEYAKKIGRESQLI